ncbi:MAG: hypothetical protein H0V89_03445, partial [Deltaproteobacteria bacterium]|nr:hypothetical protein [Deltaproteobacteria bacterium]
MRRSILLPLVALLFGFAPTGDPVQVGEDALRLEVTPAIQLRLQDRAAVRDFRARRGDWFVRFDERDGSPRLLWGPGVDARGVMGFARDLAVLAGVDPGNIRLERRLDRGGRTGWRFRQVHRGAPVEGGMLDLFAEDGRISVVQSSLHPDVHGDPRPGEVLLTGTGDRGELIWTPVRRIETVDEVRFLDRSGAVVHRWTERFYLDIELEERTAGGPLILVPAREVTVNGVDGGPFLTDALGQHPLVAPYEVTLEGPFLEVFHDPNPEPVLIPRVDDDVLNSFADFTPSAAAVATYFHVVRDWLVLNDPTNSWLPDLVPAAVDLERDSCNAFYTNGTINFHDQEGECIALGRIADVIYHEYGHGVHHYGLLGGVFAGDISEGSADFISATINDDPFTGVGMSGPGTWIREMETDKVYPTDFVDQVHTDGLIWASFLWDLREQDGAVPTDLLFLEALAYGPTLTESWLAVLAADDDDADSTNGTPNDCSLLALLDAHGIGPGPLGVVNYAHEPVADQPTGAGPAAIDFTLSAANASCSDLDPDSVTLHWALDEPVAALGDLAFTMVVPTRVGAAYTAVIPEQLPG